MAVRVIYSIVKGIEPGQARVAIEEAKPVLPGRPDSESRWSDHTYVAGQRDIDVVAHDDILYLSDDARELAKEIACRRRALHMELRVQEGDHWDFSLCRAGTRVADFSTRVGAFEDDPAAPRPWKFGDLQTFARTWGVAADRVAPYLIDWDSLHEPIYAVEGDRCRTHEWAQVYDFMRAIGVVPPHEHPGRFSVQVPTWVGVYRRQPLWRRVVRQVSVLCKGTYPDVPRTSRERREWFRKMRARVRIVHVDPKNLFGR